MTILKEFLKKLDNNQIKGLDKGIEISLGKRVDIVLQKEKAKLAKTMFTKLNGLKEAVEPITEDIISKLLQILENNAPGKITLQNAEVIDVDVPTASVLVTLFNALDDDNKNSMAQVLDKSLDKFMKVVDFATKNVKE
jgi:hypothetical protein